MAKTCLVSSDGGGYGINANNGGGSKLSAAAKLVYHRSRRDLCCQLWKRYQEQQENSLQEHFVHVKAYSIMALFAVSSFLANDVSFRSSSSVQKDNSSYSGLIVCHVKNKYCKITSQMLNFAKVWWPREVIISNKVSEWPKGIPLLSLIFSND